MNRQLRMSLALGLAMILTAAATRALAPSERLAVTRTQFDLAASIPTQFSGWSVDDALAPVAPNPDSQAALNRIYDQTLARTYIDATGQRVMLSIAYGGDQSKALQLHLPEVCYVAQGFQIVQKGNGVMTTSFGQLPVKRLVARADARNEPITYWITVGDQATRAGFSQKMHLLAYGLSGKIPDGMLVRVSTIDRDVESAYRVQDRFSTALLAALAPQARMRLLGGASTAGALHISTRTAPSTPTRTPPSTPTRTPPPAPKHAGMVPATQSPSVQAAPSVSVDWPGDADNPRR